LVATYTNERHAVEAEKGLCFVTLADKKSLALLAPCLQIIRIIVVLNEADRHCGFDHMTANNRRDTIVAMDGAID